MRTIIVKRLEAEGSHVSLETQLLAPTLNAILLIWYLGVYDNLDPGSGGTVIDGGASVGDFTLKASKWVGDGGLVIAVEPDPDNLAILKRNILMNKASNVVVVNKALGDREEKIEANGRVTETVSLDYVLRDLGIHRVDSIKLDIEGAEESAIRGGKRVIKNADHLSIETHSHEFYENIRNTLTLEGYHVYSPSFFPLVTKMSMRLLSNPFPFVFTETSRLAAWNLTKGPLVWGIVRWFFERRSPDMFSRRRHLTMLNADRHKLFDSGFKRFGFS